VLSYSVGYSTTKGHDFGWVVMAFYLVGLRGLEPRTSSLCARREITGSFDRSGGVLVACEGVGGGGLDRAWGDVVADFGEVAGGLADGVADGGRGDAEEMGEGVVVG